MKLRNKKTGEIGYPYFQNWKEITCVIVDENAIQIAEYTSLAELNEEWEDYEEPKDNGYWYYDTFNKNIDIEFYPTNTDDEKADIEIGNHFSTQEEAEKAVEKLKAWKRLKDKGFRFKGWEIPTDNRKIIIIEGNCIADSEDLELLFGGEE